MHSSGDGPLAESPLQSTLSHETWRSRKTGNYRGWVMCWRCRWGRPWWEFGHKHVSLPPPKTICMRIQRLPSVSPSPVPLCSTIPPITHTLLATSVAGLYYWHRPTTGGRWGCCAVIYDIQIQRLL